MLRRKILKARNNLHSFTATLLYSAYAPCSVLKSAMQECLFQFPDLAQKEIGVLITSDAKIKSLNKQYLFKDQTTDVLAFIYQEKDNFNYLGDIVISLDTAKKQSEKHEVPLEQEMALLLIHGILHLIGFTDYNNKEKKKMFRQQSKILKKVKNKHE